MVVMKSNNGSDSGICISDGSGGGDGSGDGRSKGDCGFQVGDDDDDNSSNEVVLLREVVTQLPLYKHQSIPYTPHTTNPHTTVHTTNYPLISIHLTATSKSPLSASLLYTVSQRISPRPPYKYASLGVSLFACSRINRH